MIGFEITYQIVDSLLLSIILILTLVMLIVVSPRDLSWVLYCFLIYVNDIANASQNSDIRLFADDTNVFVFGKSLSETNLEAEEVVKEPNSISSF